MYQGRTFIRESVYVCGNYMDADISICSRHGRRLRGAASMCRRA